jgi:hypothetical protein
MIEAHRGMYLESIRQQDLDNGVHLTLYLERYGKHENEA